MGIVFVGGNLALDFVGTLNERFSRQVEQLRTPADLGHWLVAAGVLDRAPDVREDDLVQAIALREILFDVIAREIAGAMPRLTDTERDTINAAAAVPPPIPALSSGGAVQRNGEVAAGLSAVARDAIGLFDRRDGSELKWCADDDCTHPFLDSSHGHRRRWCGMAGCGDRAKAAAYRARKAKLG
ncbi:MAG TPA: CGNR zinc finger domain-containing protein [Propionibacteriaceae bacterium]|nr:CGNR zinc finger domain-containing protein [Propionibacteriaceae bacterium]